MRKKRTKINNFIAAALYMELVLSFLLPSETVRATTSADLKGQISQHQEELSQMQEEIDALEEQQEILEEMIADLNAEILNTMTSIGLKEDEIAEKERQLIDKQEEINLTEQAYLDAKAREEKQQEDMITRTQRMYETGDSNYLSSFLLGDGLGGLLNRMDYIEEIYEYDRKKLLEFEETKLQVRDLWDQLELEKGQLETDKDQLELDKEALNTQRSSLNGMLAQKEAESANFDVEINQAKQEAAVQKKLIQQEQKKLKKLQEEEARAAQNAAGSNKGNGGSADSGNYTPTGYTDIIDGATGSDLGKKIAKYACQYIGNPYVSGGTSLTSGADCSGFTWRVYYDFNYSLPRTSYEQRSAGTGVTYGEAQPGDLICYEGHVAIYIGGGKIVHASTQKTGIKVGNAEYRTILAVRRII
ncbi:MAG: NlpC/P60 family protein [Roseburia sp.]|nr:NlpC/P60 family protein [Roseburia sp.]